MLYEEGISADLTKRCIALLNVPAFEGLERKKKRGLQRLDLRQAVGCGLWEGNDSFRTLPQP